MTLVRIVNFSALANDLVFTRIENGRAVGMCDYLAHVKQQFPDGLAYLEETADGNRLWSTDFGNCFSQPPVHSFRTVTQ